VIGYHASHEQIPPSSLLEAVRQAEAAGFGAAMCSDHIAPWGEEQGESGHAWSWLGAALEATSLPFGVVTAPVQRYHPAVSAQAIATLAEMFPERFWAALGSGEAINEHVTGEQWPRKEVRDARLLEAVEIIKELLAGEEVSSDGHIRVDRARVWSLPDTPPPLVGAAVSEQTARTVGGWADGLITVHQSVGKLRRVLEAFEEGGGSGKPAYCRFIWLEPRPRSAPDRSPTSSGGQTSSAHHSPGISPPHNSSTQPRASSAPRMWKRRFSCRPTWASTPPG
jgi:coenzyme F420-dependent glucose-6-phosphate dehydrogenase